MSDPDVVDDDREWRKVVQALKDLGQFVITVGVHGRGGYAGDENGGSIRSVPAVKPPKGGLTEAQLAAIHEFGAVIEHPGGQPYFIDEKTKLAVFAKKGTAGLPVTKPHKIVIPARSFLRATADEGIDELARFISDEIEAIIEGKRGGQTAAERVGLKLQGMILKRINAGIAPPLKAATIKRKTVRGKTGTTPLVDTGALKASITFKVRIGAGDVTGGP